jgi:hypothetical protein
MLGFYIDPMNATRRNPRPLADRASSQMISHQQLLRQLIYNILKGSPSPPRSLVCRFYPRCFHLFVLASYDPSDSWRPALRSPTPNPRDHEKSCLIPPDSSQKGQGCAAYKIPTFRANVLDLRRTIDHLAYQSSGSRPLTSGWSESIFGASSRWLYVLEVPLDVHCLYGNLHC